MEPEDVDEAISPLNLPGGQSSPSFPSFNIQQNLNKMFSKGGKTQEEEEEEMAINNLMNAFNQEKKSNFGSSLNAFNINGN